MTADLPRVTIEQVEGQVEHVRHLVDTGRLEEAVRSRDELLLWSLHTIATAPGFSDKRQLRMLAAAAMRVHEIGELHGRTTSP